MSHFKFKFPQKLEDLSHPQDDSNIFYVNDELTPMEIEQKMSETEAKLKSDPLEITSEFNIYYSVLKNFHDLDPRIVDRFFVILHRTTNQYTELLKEALAPFMQPSQQQDQSQSASQSMIQNVESILSNNDDKQHYANALKMLVFLCCSFVQQFEDHIASQSHRKDFEDRVVGSKRKRNQNGDTFIEYERYKTRTMKELMRIIAMPIGKATDSPTDIAGQVTKTCHKIIENSEFNGMTRDLDLVDICFYLLGRGIEKYKQGLSFCLKLIQMLQQRDKLVQLLADLVESIVTKHDQKLLIGDILREIDRIDVRELSRDTSGPKAIAFFLIALSEKCPKEIIQSIDHVFGWLDQESYHMRQASLSIFTNLISNHFFPLGEEADSALRDEILNALLTHICDISCYTRTKALNCWHDLCERRHIPLKFIKPVMTETIDRIMDKTCMVRKSAIRFITTMLKNNPFTRITKFSLPEFLEVYKKEKAELDRLKKEEEEKGQEVLETLSQDSERTMTSQNDPDQTNPPAPIPRSQAFAQESATFLQQQKLNVVRDVIEFTRQIHNAIPLIANLLRSKTVTDITEAIDFFVVCFELGIDEAMVGFKEMIRLIHEDKNIKEPVVAAYRRIFFDSIRYQGKSNRNQLVIANLLQFVKEASIGECLSLQKLIGQFLASGDLKKEMESELWAIYTRVKSDTTTQDACAAIQIIGMIAATQPAIINQNILLCNQYGFAQKGLTADDSKLITETCIAIRKALPPRVEERVGCPRFMPEFEMFVLLEDILVESFTNLNSTHWPIMCDEIIRLMFDVAEKPQKICESIHYKMTDRLYQGAKHCSLITEETDRASPDFFKAQDLEQAQPVALARFIHFIGQVALTLCIFLETTVLFELKARNVPAGGDVSRHNISTHNISISSRRRSRRYGNVSMEEDKGLEDEVGLGGAEAEDVELEAIERICDEEIVCGDGLLAQMSGLILEVCRDPKRYHHLELKRASTLALGKFMTVSAKFCHQHLRLLFTILEKTQDNSIKVNLLVIISDLCMRFPNQLDGWTGKIFDCLQSQDITVRRTALKLLSRLVLGDILKAKDQISTMANLIVDDDEHLASQARRFFVELDKKVNAIYNIMPDIISRLSDAKTGISEERFRKVMRFLFDLMTKGQHVDRLVDKLCGRFMETDNERQWSDLAYCFSLLKHTDRSIMNLIEKYDCYKDKLCIDSVHDSLSSTIAAYKKTPNLRAEVKQALDEFEAKLNNEDPAESNNDEDATQVAEKF